MRNKQNLEVIVNEIITMSNTNDISNFMYKTVELILSNFNLHFVGFHLIDWTSNEIFLQAGTGIIGKKLVSKGWGLPFTIRWIGEVIQFSEARLVNCETDNMYKYPSSSKTILVQITSLCSGSPVSPIVSRNSPLSRSKTFIPP